MVKLVNKDFDSSIINKVISKEISLYEAIIKLEISDRQVRRLVVKFNDNGDEAFIHQNSGKSSDSKKIPAELADGIIGKYLCDCYYFGFSHFYEEYGCKYAISLQSMINIFNNNDIISPYVQHKTVKLYNKK